VIEQQTCWHELIQRQLLDIARGFFVKTQANTESNKAN
jgi:hypothetical protein